MGVFDKYDEIIQEMKYLKNIQAEIEKKTRVLQARLVDPGVSVQQAYSAYKYLDCEIDVLWEKARKFEAFCKGLSKADRDVLNGILSGVNIFVFSDTVGMPVGTIYAKLHNIINKYEESKQEGKAYE